jgi:hypothetical protein
MTVSREELFVHVIVRQLPALVSLVMAPPMHSGVMLVTAVSHTMLVAA